MHLITALKKQRQAGVSDFQASQEYIVSPCSTPYLPPKSKHEIIIKNTGEAETGRDPEVH